MTGLSGVAALSALRRLALRIGLWTALLMTACWLVTDGWGDAWAASAAHPRPHRVVEVDAAQARTPEDAPLIPPARLSASGMPPWGSAAWSPRTLPDARTPGSTAAADDETRHTTWYRIAVDPALRDMAEPLFFYLPRWQTVGVVSLYADDQLIWVSEGDPVWNGFNRPLGLVLDALDGSPRPAVLTLRMDTLGEHGGGITAPWLGARADLRWRHAVRSFLQNSLPLGIGLGMLGLGLYALAIWGARRRDTLYLLFVMVSVLYTVRCLHYWGPLDPAIMRSDWFGWLTINSLSWLVMLGLTINFRLCGARPRVWLERVLAASVLGTSLLTLPGWRAPEDLAALAFACYLLMLACALIAIPILLLASWRSGRAPARTLAVLNLLALPLAVHDLMLQRYLLPLDQPYLMAYWQISVAIVFGWAMARRYIDSIDGLERSGEKLALSLAERESELRQSYEQLRAVEQRELLTQERARIMRDMHDGLGGTLHDALRLSQQGADAGPGLQQALRECLDELRLAIDSLDPVEADLALLLGTLRYRLDTRLKHAGITLQWQVDTLPPLGWMSASHAFHILRILQEAITNIIKHAQASTIRVDATADEGRVTVSVHDNGIGMTAGRARTGGRGLANIRNRAEALQATVQWLPGQADHDRARMEAAASPSAEPEQPRRGTTFVLQLPQSPD